MPVWVWFVDSIGVLLLLVLLFGLCLVFRRRWITRHGGTFELSHRVRSGADDEWRRSGRGWVLGLGRYSGGRLEFFRIFSLSPRPKDVMDRGDLTYDGQRDPVGTEAHSLYAGHVIVSCHSSSQEFELAMTAEAVTGFLSWLESAPPGRNPMAH
jgi:Protein of unknown function (DUF2550)